METEPDCRENILHALPIKHLDPNTLDKNEREYVDALLELDF
ncbi:hypothetical protein [Kitasatospora sp. NPDC059673]